jgi:hypothetical protein
VDKFTLPVSYSETETEPTLDSSRVKDIKPNQKIYSYLSAEILYRERDKLGGFSPAAASVGSGYQQQPPLALPLDQEESVQIFLVAFGKSLWRWY